MQQPDKCYDCGQKTLIHTTIAYEFKVRYDGILHDIFMAQLPVLRCPHCNAVFFDHITGDRQDQAIREHLGLLSPGEIEGALAAQGYSIDDIGKLIPKLEDILTGCWIQTYEEDYKLRTLLGITP